MKPYCYIFISILLAAGSTSCKKSFLDEGIANTRILTRQDYVKDLKTTSEYLSGIYTKVASDLFSGYHIIYPELAADNIKPVVGTGAGGATPLGAHYEWNQRVDDMSSTSVTSTSFNCNELSYGAYQLIRSCNFVLEKATEYKDQDPSLADAMMGQAYAIRALSHFFLVNVFAQSYNFSNDASHPGIVYITSVNWTDPIKSRNTVAEVYVNVIQDLKAAVSLLPVASSSTLTMNRNAAIGLLARVYLFKGDWGLAKNLARQVVAAVPIMTANYPSKLFTLEEKEVLFQLPPGIFPVDQYGSTFPGAYFRSDLQFRATADIASLLNEDPNDARKVWVTSVLGNWHITKFPVNVVTGGFSPDGAYYHSVLRSSELYLMAAEAYAQLNNVDSARFYLDAIRMRANPAALPTTTSGIVLLEAIYKERRKELAFEGWRMFDLLRWKKGVTRADALSAAAQMLPYPSNKAISPIPGLDVKVSDFVQNLDY
ncbi:MAG TPA: RagB/SusD family nutrient uptake outer membrane protein [Pedobacter sp.]|uniref:RagB/SusD family nutrient uptake outer membrane protein n=1 Tax=Pedobacter sp. TaxID=1411316 RepID=UPI002CE7F022|nr:RagB/SusD family nutrient uptake outer membrane protein [Pedobacter sp.]HMI04008.1 RagB/SusD family nutrient uptake outer membrane protein [Pedobacter sp.]